MGGNATRRLAALAERVDRLGVPRLDPDAPAVPVGGTILDALALLGPLFADPTWAPWVAVLKALFGLPLGPEELVLFQRCTGRTAAPATAVREAWLIVGRRGGKSRIAALVAVFLACFRDYTRVLVPGEVGTVMVLAADRRQAQVCFKYVAALLDAVPELRGLVVKQLKESVLLANGVAIGVHASSYQRVRGYTLLGAVLDEVAFWPTDESGANPDTAVLAALRPAMATVPGALLLAISTPYARRGALWEARQRWWGRDEAGVPLVWQADTATMNAAVDRAVIAQAYADDPIAAAAEYGADFRSDVEAFLSLDAVQAVVVPDRRELPVLAGVRYVAFTDPSGGSQDSFTLAIAHRAEERAVLDCVREIRPPFSPDQVCGEFAQVLASYGISEVTGDHYAGEWPRERFRAHGVTYRPAEQPKSALYQAMLPAVNAGRVELLEHPRLVAQLVGLERRVARSGKDSIDHAPGGHDDVANAAAGALGLVLGALRRVFVGVG